MSSRRVAITLLTYYLERKWKLLTYVLQVILVINGFFRSRTSLQHLKMCSMLDTELAFLSYTSLSSFLILMSQWIRYYVDLRGHEVADKLFKEKCEDTCTSSPFVTILELFTNKKLLDTLSSLTSSTQYSHNTSTLALLSVLIVTDVPKLRFLDLSLDILRTSSIEGKKIYAICARWPYGINQNASPKYILECCDLFMDNHISNPRLVLDFIRISNIMNLLWLRSVVGGLATTTVPFLKEVLHLNSRGFHKIKSFKTNIKNLQKSLLVWDILVKCLMQYCQDNFNTKHFKGQ